MGTDGKYLLYNPEFLDSITPDQAAGAVLHETLHCAFQHVWRRGKRDPQRWNIATDYAINSIVTESFPLPEGCLVDSKFYGMSAEEIYEQLPKTKKQKQQSWCDKQKWDGGKSGKSDPGEGKQEGAGGIKGVFKKLATGNGKGKKKSLSPSEKARIKAQWKELFEKSILKNYGKMPESIKRVIEKSYYMPVIDWTSLIANLLSEDTTDYSFSVPDRRFLESDFTLPDMSSLDRLKDVVFAYDTSGSINNVDLFSYYMESLALFNNFSSLTGWIAICDAALHSFKTITAQDSFNQFDFIGGGGTDFRPVFDKIKKEGLNPKALFYFTDCEGSFPDKEPPYPVFWLVRSDIGNNWSPPVPWGTVVKFLAK